MQQRRRERVRRSRTLCVFLVIVFSAFLVTLGVCLVQSIHIASMETHSEHGTRQHVAAMPTTPNTETLRRIRKPRYIIGYDTGADREHLFTWMNDAAQREHVHMRFECRLAKALVVECDSAQSLHVLQAMQQHSENDTTAHGFRIRIMQDDMARLHLGDTLEQMNVDSVHEQYQVRGSPNVRVCVIDTGVNAQLHTSLNVVEARDFTGSQLGAQDENGHGTFVSGIVASQHPTYTGVAPQTALYSAKVCDGAGSCLTSDIIEGIEWCALNVSAHVINLSLGTVQTFTGECDQLHPLAQVATAAAAQLDTVVVSSSGNDFLLDRMSAPGCASRVLSVGSVDKQDVRADYSNGGTQLDVVATGGSFNAAPQSLVKSALFNQANAFGNFGVGTSYSAPHVAGLAALLRQVNASLDEQQVRTIIEQTSVDLGSAGRDNLYGHGRVDALAAVRQAGPDLQPVQSTSTTTTATTTTTTTIPQTTTTTLSSMSNTEEPSSSGASRVRTLSPVLILLLIVAFISLFFTNNQ